VAICFRNYTATDIEYVCGSLTRKLKGKVGKENPPELYTAMDVHIA
jgi:hypothetical protein